MLAAGLALRRLLVALALRRRAGHGSRGALRGRAAEVVGGLGAATRRTGVTDRVGGLRLVAGRVSTMALRRRSLGLGRRRRLLLLLRGLRFLALGSHRLAG